MHKNTETTATYLLVCDNVCGQCAQIAFVIIIMFISDSQRLKKSMTEDLYN